MCIQAALQTLPQVSVLADGFQSPLQLPHARPFLVSKRGPKTFVMGDADRVNKVSIERSEPSVA